jgi:predicted nucleic acid-binding protein
VLYADASALVKLAASEAESSALRTYLQEVEAELVTSIVARVEVGRAMRRVGVSAPNPLDGVRMVALKEEVIKSAVAQEPHALRTLHAVHLATVLLLRDEIEAFVAYDERLLAAAEQAGLPTVTPR